MKYKYFRYIESGVIQPLDDLDNIKELKKDRNIELLSTHQIQEEIYEVIKETRLLYKIRNKKKLLETCIERVNFYVGLDFDEFDKEFSCFYNYIVSKIYT
jgi:predicted nucleic acid-binding protein